MKLNLGQDYEARFGQDDKCLIEIPKLKLDLCATCDMNSTLGSVVPLAMFQITAVLNTGLSLSESLQLYKGYNAI